MAIYTWDSGAISSFVLLVKFSSLSHRIIFLLDFVLFKCTMVSSSTLPSPYIKSSISLESVTSWYWKMTIFCEYDHQDGQLFLMCQGLCVDKSRRHICVFSHVFIQVYSCLSIIIHICSIEFISLRLPHHSFIICVYLIFLSLTEHDYITCTYFFNFSTH